MRELVSEDHELCRGLKSRQDLNGSATGGPQRAAEFLDVVHRDALRGYRPLQVVRSRPRIAVRVGRLGQRVAVSLRNVEHVRRAKSDDGLRIAVRCSYRLTRLGSSAGLRTLAARLLVALLGEPGVELATCVHGDGLACWRVGD